MYQIKNEAVFEKYLDFCLNKELGNLKEVAREQLLQAALGPKASDPKERSQYFKLKDYPEKLRAQKNLLRRQIASKYSPLSACKNIEILSEYEKIEDMAIEIDAAGEKIDFANIFEQYNDLDFYKLNISSLIRENEEQIRENIKRLVDEYFSTKQVVCFESECYTWDEDDDEDDDYEYYDYDSDYKENPVTENNYETFEEEILYDCLDIFEYLQNHTDFTGFTDEFIIDQFCYTSPEAMATIHKRGFDNKALELIENCDVYGKLIDELAEIWTPKHLLETLRKNPYHVETAESIYERERIEEEKRLTEKRKREEAKQRKEIILKNIVSKIPEKIEDFFPVARKLHRRFVLHVGPTNSGKTHEAIEAMKTADSGVYLAPLRLLAYEQYTTLNADGYPCDMLTGEELLKQDNAKYTASTIEMLSLEKRYDVAVIDEAQMIADKNRGGAWLRAILGVLAEEVHVCMAPEALNIIVKLVEICGDEYIVKKHERMADLCVENHEFIFPKDVQKGDALIVFSRQNVHAVARELQNRGHNVSILYGNLPHDVRHKEAEKFAEGESDIVVSTDCIGMGMNLPIRRIVFLETSKYDGTTTRQLNFAEIKQISGRAGRYGIYDMGFVNSCGDQQLIQKAIDGQVQNIEKAFITFPESLIGIQGNLSEIIEQWQKVVLPEMYEKEDTYNFMLLARQLERFYENKDKKLIYDLASIPFDVRNITLKNIWTRLSYDILDDKNPETIDLPKYIPEVQEKVYSSEDLAGLEEKYQICDLLYNFSRKFGLCDTEEISYTREIISKIIMDVLKTSKLTHRKCKRCGRKIPWNYPYGICENCYRNGHNSYSYGFDYDFYDF